MTFKDKKLVNSTLINSVLPNISIHNVNEFLIFKLSWIKAAIQK